VIRRHVLIEIGGFNEMYNQVEEWDLWLRVARHYDLAFVPSCETRIRFHNSNTSRNYQIQQQEIEQLLCSLDVDEQFEDARCYAQNWFKVRFAVIDVMHKLNGKLGKKLEGLYLLLRCLLRHPMISIRMMRGYLNPTMLHFFYAKYFQRRV